MLKTGDTYVKPFSIAQEQVNQFAELSGDNNPLHLDAEYAATTAFKTPIVHGIFTASVFSKVLGTEFPGEGTVYLSQNLEFKRPIFPDKDYEARFEIVETVEGKSTATITTEVYEMERGKLVLQGSAKVMNKSKIV